MKRVLIILSPILISFATVYGVYKYFEKDIKFFVIEKSTEILESQLPAKVQIGGFELELLNLGFRIEDVSVTLKTKEPDLNGPLQIGKLRMHLDFLQLLTGRLYLSSVIFDGVKASLNIDHRKEPEGKKEFQPEKITRQLFVLLRDIPVYRVAALNSDVEVNFAAEGYSVHLEGLDVIAFNRQDKVNLRMELSNGLVKMSNGSSVPLHARLELGLTTHQLEVYQLDVSLVESNFQMKGDIDNITRGINGLTGNIQLKTDARLNSWLLLLGMEKELPSLIGSMQTEVEMKLSPELRWSGKIKSSVQGLEIGTFKIGNIELHGNFQNGVAKLNDLLLEHPSGKVSVKNLELEIPLFHLADGIKLRGSLSTDKVSLHDLLQALNVGDLNLQLAIAANLNCEGIIRRDVNVKCQGELTGTNFEVGSGKPIPSNTICEFKELHAKGDVTVTSKDVTFKADLKTGDDVGTTDGKVVYADGFDIHFNSPDLHLTNISNLANLKIEGHGAIDGRTYGDSSAGKLEAHVELQNGYLEDFELGNAKTDLAYRSGKLSFSDIDGNLGTTKYQGDVNLDLRLPLLTVDIDSRELEVADVFRSLRKKFTLPIDITGRGLGSVHVSGPLKLGALSYKVSVKTDKGLIAGESYDKFNGEVEAVDGEVDFKKVFLTKNKSVVSVFGKGHPNGDIDLSVRAERFLLEESENVARLGGSISGVIDAQMSLSGFILNPDMTMQVSLSKLEIEDQDFPDSRVQFAVNKKGMEGTATLFGQKLRGTFLIPLSNEDPFRLHMVASDWNYAVALAALGGGTLLSDYQASLSGKIDLESNSGGFFNASGNGRVDYFILRRGSQGLRNTRPMTFTMKDGKMNLHDFALQSTQLGDDSFFSASGNNFTKDKLQMQIEGKTHLRLFQIFLPFLEELGGDAQGAIAISGKFLKPEVLGNFNLQNGFVKIKGLQHPFERIESEVQFSASEIQINKLGGTFGGGIIKSDGTIQIESPTSFPVNITGHLENASLNIPDGIHTVGSGDFTLSGKWFPFLLSGTYYVQSGLVSKEFAETGGSGNIKQSSYLPKIILKSAFQPLAFDLNVALARPLPVKNSLVEGSVSGQIQIKGSPEDPSLMGQITTEKNTKLIFKDKYFDVSSGSVKFRNLTEINPEIYVSGSTRVTDYDINLIVQGVAKNPTIRLTSVPPLNESDIVSLLALGVVATKSDKLNSQRNDNQTSAMTLGSALISNTKVGKELQNTFGVNVQLSSSYDDTQNISTQKITLTKKISDKVNLAASRVQSQQNSNEYQIRYSLSPNLSAVGSYEERQAGEDPNSTATSTLRRSDNIFGLDLEFKREFK